MGKIAEGVGQAQKMLALGATTPQDQIQHVWARRSIARAMASTGRFAQLKVGLELIEKNVDPTSGVLSTKTCSSRPTCWEQMPGAKDRDTAIAMVEAQIAKSERAHPSHLSTAGWYRFTNARISGQKLAGRWKA